MADVLIRDVPEKTLNVLRKRAAARRRSLQQELKLLLEREAAWAAVDHGAEAMRLREHIARHYPRQTDSARLIREDRDANHARPVGATGPRRSRGGGER